MRICLIPLKTTHHNYAENYREVELRLAEIVPEQQPEIVCLPECTLTGYLYKQEEFDQFAESIPGPTTQRMSELTAKYGVYLCFGLVERQDGCTYNTAVLLDSKGQVLLKHRKNNEKPPYVNGDGVEHVETEFGKVSIVICADIVSEEVMARLDPDLDYLIVPMSRAFDGVSPDQERWEKEGRAEYVDVAKSAGIATMIVNALEVGVEEPSFGGALIRVCFGIREQSCRRIRTDGRRPTSFRQLFPQFARLYVVIEARSGAVLQMLC